MKAGLLALLALALSQCLSDVASTHCFDPTCGTRYIDEVSCDCRAEDIGYSFSACGASQTRTLSYFWKPPALCRNPGEFVSLPAPVSGIPCSLSCPAGSYLEVSNMSCVQCAAGSASSGGTVTYNKWLEWPGQFDSYCLTKDGSVCDSWRLNGDHIDSGRQQGFHGITSVLQLRVTLRSNGTVSFDYWVESEAFDGLQFLIDRQQQFSASNSTGARFTSWDRFSGALSAGQHLLEWRYTKDMFGESEIDVAMIKQIVIDGINPAATSCKKCRPGFFAASAGATQCDVCPRSDTSDAGATSCKPCDPNTYSLLNDHRCYPKPPCGSEHAVYTWGTCTGSPLVKNESVAWVDLRECNVVSDPKSLRALNSVACNASLCRPGEFWNSTQQQCALCPAGTYSSTAGATSCFSCADTMAPVKQITYYDDFSRSLPIGFTSSCGVGTFCFGSWRVMGSYIDSGVGHGIPASSKLQYSFVLQEDGSFSFDYSMICSYPNYVEVVLDDVKIGTAQGLNMICRASCSSNANTNINWYTANLTLSKGAHTISWTYNKVQQANSTCDRVLLRRFVVVGLSDTTSLGLIRGGATQCASCPAGQHPVSGSNLCQPCPAGTFAASGSRDCTQCGANQFSFDGDGACRACGAGTTAQPGSLSCGYQCSAITASSIDPVLFANSSLSFNLTAISTPGVLTRKISGLTGLRSLFVNICEERSVCQDSHNAFLHNAYACIVDPFGGASDVGDRLSFSVISDPASSTGAICKFVTNSVSTDYACVGLAMKFSTDSCSTTVNLLCQASAGEGVPYLVEADDVACRYTVNWVTTYGCPVCTDSQLNRTLGQCVSKSQSVITTPIANAQCQGYTTITTQPCYSTGLSEAGVVILVLFIIIILGIAAIALYRRNKELRGDLQIAQSAAATSAFGVQPRRPKTKPADASPPSSPPAAAAVAPLPDDEHSGSISSDPNSD